ncbi:MAG TPA: hypothetical protein VEA15_07480 [Caulobacteraceae bacterium]|nr:hypothetical protein [Caulobacteraceae bacterium]
MRRGLALLAALAATAIAAPATAQPATTGLPYRIEAERGAEYRLVCKFRAIRTWGRMLANQYKVRDKGPSRGRLPSDNARCVLTKLGGRGAVVLTIVKGGVRTARAETPGQPVKLTVS